jgi:hypothetical protein
VAVLPRGVVRADSLPSRDCVGVFLGPFERAASFPRESARNGPSSRRKPGHHGRVFNQHQTLGTCAEYPFRAVNRLPNNHKVRPNTQQRPDSLEAWLWLVELLTLSFNKPLPGWPREANKGHSKRSSPGKSSFWKSGSLGVKTNRMCGSKKELGFWKAGGFRGYHCSANGASIGWITEVKLNSVRSRPIPKKILLQRSVLMAAVKWSNRTSSTRG